MPIEIKELIVRAIVGNSDVDSNKKGRRKSKMDHKERHKMAEMLEQMKQMMLDHKER